jgi:HSP20 family molecular chaperone IbpA
MQGQDTMAWMLSAAVEQLERADRLQRQFFRLAQRQPEPCWEPPVDVGVSEEGLHIVVALPGVASDRLDVALEGSAIVVRGERSLGSGLLAGEILRLEIPHGRFERRIALPYGSYCLAEMQMEHGCLTLHLERLT